MIDEIDVPILFAGQTYTFRLCHRQIHFRRGDGLKVRYYWMDTRALRDGRSRACRACIDLWWATMEMIGLTQYQDGAHEAVNEQVYAIEVNYVLALLYRLVAKSKGRQSVFQDAFPHPQLPGAAARGDNRYTLEASETKRLKKIVEKRDIPAIRDEITTAFGAKPPSALELPAYKKAFRRWMENGVGVLRSGGRPALERFLQDEVFRWMERYRRRGDGKAKSRRYRRFINTVAYEAKLAFITCFANAWVYLIPWLRQNEQLDWIGEHLLWVWNHQGSRDRGDDALWGQMLSLLPISAALLEEADHRVVLGEYLASVSPNGAGGVPALGDNPAYWNLIESILVACHEYARRINSDERQQRATVSHTQMVADSAERDDAEVSPGLILEEYAIQIGLHCAACGGEQLEYADLEAVSGQNLTMRVDYCCKKCGQIRTIDVTAVECLGNDAD